MTEVFLELIPDADINIARCSICKEQFHSSPVGPRKCMKDFPQHVRERHPEAALHRKPWELFRRRDNRLNSASDCNVGELNQLIQSYRRKTSGLR